MLSLGTWGRPLNSADDIRELFKWALTIFGSRSFSPSAIRELRDDRSSQPLLETHNPHSLLYPAIDLLNHNTRTRNRWSGTRHTFDIVLHDTPGPGEEMWNTYGCQSNAQLMLSWGFCLKDNQYDSYALQLLSDTHRPLLRSIHDASMNATLSSDPNTHEEGRPQTPSMSAASMEAPIEQSGGMIIPTAADQMGFTACDLSNSVFMVRDPDSIEDDEDDYPPPDDPTIAHLRGFPELLLSSFAAQVITPRERQRVEGDLPSFSSSGLYKQLGARNMLQLGELLKEKLELTKQSISSPDSTYSEQSQDLSGLSKLSRKRFEQVRIYRESQARILETNVRKLHQHSQAAQMPQTSGSVPELLTLRSLLHFLDWIAPELLKDFVCGYVTQILRNIYRGAIYIPAV